MKTLMQVKMRVYLTSVITARSAVVAKMYNV